MNSAVAMNPKQTRAMIIKILFLHFAFFVSLVLNWSNNVTKEYFISKDKSIIENNIKISF